MWYWWRYHCTYICAHFHPCRKKLTRRICEYSMLTSNMYCSWQRVSKIGYIVFFTTEGKTTTKMKKWTRNFKISNFLCFLISRYRERVDLCDQQLQFVYPIAQVQVTHSDMPHDTCLDFLRFSNTFERDGAARRNCAYALYIATSTWTA